ncbi:hypothetical protein [Streptomyces sp. NPDC058579]|uniref:hypothetical protein n=1 Tax=Streptomyces sp. NPDC058579 TaxID=3346548 RepID=UPI00364EE465
MTDDGDHQTCGGLAASAIPLGLVGGILFGMAWLDDVGLGLTLGLGVGAVIAGTGSRDWGWRVERDAG